MILTAATALNITSLMGLVCIFMLCILLRPIIHSTDVALILAANNYLALLAFAILSIRTNIDMLRRDFNLLIGEETSACLIRGYLLYVFMAAIFNTFALQVGLKRIQADQLLFIS
jgi:hypothetical protein